MERNVQIRPAHAPGHTVLAYTPNGSKLITAGLNDAVRVFDTTTDGEPVNIDNCSDSNTALVATNDFFVLGSEDGSVAKYSLHENALEQLLTRSSLPVRSLALSADAQWVAVASEFVHLSNLSGELTVKVVHTGDMTRVKYIRDLPRPVKHVSFDYDGDLLAVSCTDGVAYFYSLLEDEPQLKKKMDGLMPRLTTEDTASAEIKWHPEGTAFAVPTVTRDVQVVSTHDWERQRSFKGGHNADITALSWSPNGAFLVTAGKDRKLTLWLTKTQRILQQFSAEVVTAFSWHPVHNTLSYTDQQGQLNIHSSFVPQDFVSALDPASIEPAPLYHPVEPLKEVSGNAGRVSRPLQKPKRQGTPDSLIDGFQDDDQDFVEDDDGAGYGERLNGNNKRLIDLDEDDHLAKRQAVADDWAELHEAFQPGSTPWRGNRRYLCQNLVGAVWTVDQDSHKSVTVEFLDHDMQRNFHFTDTFSYDKACLTEKGSLFSSLPESSKPTRVYYRPHESWTSGPSDWSTSLPADEAVTSMALSDSYIVLTTSQDYVRIFSLFGVPVRVYRQKSTPAVTCACWRDYLLTVGNGPTTSDGSTKLLYTIENIKRDEVLQNEDTVALSQGSSLRNVFFSDAGDPCIYDSTGVLLVLQHWRTPSQARWVPLLDTKLLERLAGGRKDESYWPVGVTQNKFYCIILKGGDKHPYFPRAPLTDFDFAIPLCSVNTEDEKKEETFVRTSLLHSLEEDLLASTHATAVQQNALSQKQLDIDKALLELLASACRQGEEMKAFDVVSLIRDRTGRILDAAIKVAARYERPVLREKISELAERRHVGLDVDDD